MHVTAVVFALIVLMCVDLYRADTTVQIMSGTTNYYLDLSVTGHQPNSCGDVITKVQVYTVATGGYCDNLDSWDSGTRWSFRANACGTQSQSGFQSDLSMTMRLLRACGDPLILTNMITSLAVGSKFTRTASICDGVAQCDLPPQYTPTNDPTYTTMQPTMYVHPTNGSINPTTQPTSNPTNSVTRNNDNGIAIKINFQYETNSTNPDVDVENILTNITRTIIQEKINNASICVNDQEYDIMVVLNTTNNQSYATITLALYGCDNGDDDTLIAVLTPEDLSKTFIESAGDNGELIVHEDTVNVDVGDIVYFGDTTTTKTGDGVDGIKNNGEKEDVLGLVDILVILIVSLLLIIAGLLIFYLWRRRMRNKETDAYQIEVGKCSPSTRGLDGSVATLGTEKGEEDRNILTNDANDSDDDLYSDDKGNGTPIVGNEITPKLGPITPSLDPVTIAPRLEPEHVRIQSESEIAQPGSV